MNQHILITVKGPEESLVAAKTRELLKEIRIDADPHAHLLARTQDPHSKGGIVDLGQIALALVTGGAVGKFIDSLFNFLSRNRKLVVAIQNKSGEKLNINMEFVDGNGLDKAIRVAEAFLKGD